MLSCKRRRYLYPAVFYISAPLRAAASRGTLKWNAHNIFSLHHASVDIPCQYTSFLISQNFKATGFQDHD